MSKSTMKRLMNAAPSFVLLAYSIFWLFAGTLYTFGKRHGLKETPLSDQGKLFICAALACALVHLIAILVDHRRAEDNGGKHKWWQVTIMILAWVFVYFAMAEGIRHEREIAEQTEKVEQQARRQVDQAAMVQLQAFAKADRMTRACASSPDEAREYLASAEAAMLDVRRKVFEASNPVVASGGKLLNTLGDCKQLIHEGASGNASLPPEDAFNKLQASVSDIHMIFLTQASTGDCVNKCLEDLALQIKQSKKALGNLNPPTAK